MKLPKLISFNSVNTAGIVFAFTVQFSLFYSHQLSGQTSDTAEVMRLIDSSRKVYRISPNNARMLIQESITLSEKLTFHKGLGKAYMNLGVLDYLKGDYYNSLLNYQKADSVYNLIKDSSGLATLYSNRGVVFILSENYSKALDDFLRAIEINKKANNQSKLSMNYANMAGIYNKEKKYEKAIEYYNKSLKINEELHDSIGYANTLGNIGGILVYQNKFDSALTCFNRSYKIYKSINSKIDILYCYNHYGVLYENKKEFQLARSYFLKSVDLSDSLQMLNFKNTALGNVASTYFKEENYESALIWMQKENILAVERNDSLEMQRSYRHLADVYTALERYKDANSAMRRYEEIRFELDKKNREQLIKNIDLRNQLFYQEKEMNLLTEKNNVQQLEIQRNRILLYGSVVVFFLIIFIIIIIIRLRNQRMNNTNQQLQYQVLRTQIDPHFIFNIFNSIQSYFINKKYDEGVIYLRKFARLMRGFLEKSEHSFLLLKEEVEIMREYLEIEKLRLSGKMNYLIEVDKELDLQLKIPTFLTQSFIENAIVHGMPDETESGLVEIYIDQHEDFIQIRICDNGIGINKTRKLMSNGTGVHESRGIDMIMERVAYLNKQNLGKFQVDISDRADKDKNTSGTEVNLIIPIIN